MNQKIWREIERIRSEVPRWNKAGHSLRTFHAVCNLGLKISESITWVGSGRPSKPDLFVLRDAVQSRQLPLGGPSGSISELDQISHGLEAIRSQIEDGSADETSPWTLESIDATQLKISRTLVQMDPMNEEERGILLNHLHRLGNTVSNRLLSL